MFLLKSALILLLVSVTITKQSDPLVLPGISYGGGLEFERLYHLGDNEHIAFSVHASDLLYCSDFEKAPVLSFLLSFRLLGLGESYEFNFAIPTVNATTLSKQSVIHFSKAGHQESSTNFNSFSFTEPMAVRAVLNFKTREFVYQAFPSLSLHQFQVAAGESSYTNQVVSIQMKSSSAACVAYYRLKDLAFPPESTSEQILKGSFAETKKKAKKTTDEGINTTEVLTTSSLYAGTILTAIIFYACVGILALLAVKKTRKFQVQEALAIRAKKQAHSEDDGPQ